MHSDRGYLFKGICLTVMVFEKEDESEYEKYTTTEHNQRPPQRKCLI
jgi:hypothetical protein